MNKIRFVVIFTLMLIGLVVISQRVFAYSIDWENVFSFDDESRIPWDRGLSIDSEGNTFIAGEVNMDSNNELYLRKVNEIGDEVWTRRFRIFQGATAENRIKGMANDSLGNVYVAGESCTSYIGSTCDGFLRKYDSLGNVLWSRIISFGVQAGSPIYSSGDTISDISIDDLDNVYIVGKTNGTLQGQHNFGLTDAFVEKFNPSGNLIWGKQYGTANVDWANKVVSFADENILIESMTDSSGYFLKMLDASGTETWSTSISSYLTHIYDIASDQFGNVYVAGYTQQDAMPTTNSFIAKYDHLGNLIWDKTYYLDINNQGNHIKKIDIKDLSIDVVLHISVSSPVSYDVIRQLDLDGNVTITTTRFPYVIHHVKYLDSNTVAIAGTFVTLIGKNKAYINKVKLSDNLPPVSNIGPDQAVDEGNVTMFDGSGSSDPDGVADIINFIWNYGDGSTGNGADTTHAYADNGVYTATLTITDSVGHVSSDTVTVTVNNVSPTANFSISSQTIFQGQSSILSFSNPYDPSSVDTLSGFTYSYDCTGDGIYEVLNSLNPSYSCNYPNSGVYSAGGKIKDKDGGISNYLVNITVQTPAQALSSLIGIVQAFNLQQGISNSLDTKLETAMGAMSDINVNNDQAAINSLQAFINAVEAQRNNKITNEQADILIFNAQQIIDNLQLNQ